MIDSINENLLTLNQVADELPHRQGRKIHISTIYRWTIAGCRGVILESIQIGGTRATSREALQRFFDQLTNKVTNIPKYRTVLKRQRQSEAAEKRLKELGA